MKVSRVKFMDMSDSYLIDICYHIEEEYVSSILKTVLKLALLDSVLGFPACGKINQDLLLYLYLYNEYLLHFPNIKPSPYYLSKSHQFILL